MISHQHSRVDYSVVLAHVAPLIALLQERGISYFYSNEYSEMFAQREWDYDTRLAWCIGEQRKARKMVFVITHDVESKGMLAELALAKELGLPSIVCLHASVQDAAWAEPFRVFCTDMVVYEDVLSEVHERIL